MSVLASNSRKAAILIAALDAETAESLLAQLEPYEAALLREAADRLGTVAEEEQRAVLDEFMRIGPFSADEQQGGVELEIGLARRLGLERDSVPEPPSARHDGESPFRFLEDFGSAERLLPLLAGEHPQTIALVVSHLAPDRSVQVLSGLSSELQADVIRRLIDIEDANPAMVKEVERGLESRLSEHDSQSERRAAGVSTARRILAAAGRGVARRIHANIARHDSQLARLLDGRPFEFDDLMALDTESLWTVLTEIDAEALVLAIAGGSSALADRVLDLLPPGTSLRLRRRLESLGPTSLSDIEEAQREIAEVAKALELEGRIQRSKTIATYAPLSY